MYRYPAEHALLPSKNQGPVCVHLSRKELPCLMLSKLEEMSQMLRLFWKMAQGTNCWCTFWKQTSNLVHFHNAHQRF